MQEAVQSAQKARGRHEFGLAFRHYRESLSMMKLQPVVQVLHRIVGLHIWAGRDEDGRAIERDTLSVAAAALALYKQGEESLHTACRGAASAN